MHFFTKSAIFTTAVKIDQSVKINELAAPIERVVKNFLMQIPIVSIASVQREKSPSHPSNPRADLIVELSDGARDWVVLVEAKTMGHPSRLTNAIEQLAHFSRAPNKYAVLVVPWMSPKLEADCRTNGIGCLDLEGNGMLRFGNIFARSVGQPPPRKEVQGLRSLFKTKATRVLQLMLI